MKQKIFKLSMILAMAAGQTAMGQSGALSVRLDVGAGFPSGVGTVTNYNNGTYSISPYSLGAGFNIALAGNYMFSYHIGAGLDLNDVMGFASTQTYSSNSGGSASVKAVSVGSLFAITPNLILSANSEGINPYARFGIVIGIASYTTTTTETGPSAPSGTNIDSYTGGSAMGWYAGFGVQFPLGGNLKLDVELFDRDVTYLPGKYTNTQPYDNVTAQPTQSLGTSSSDSHSLSQYVPFGSVGLKVGVQLSLGK